MNRPRTDPAATAPPVARRAKRGRSLVVAGLAALLVTAPSTGAQVLSPCPLAAPAPPQMEGVEQYVVVGQHQPCPPPNRTWQDFAVTTDFGDGVVAETPYRDGDPLWFIGGRHAYRRAGTYELTGTATDRLTGEQVVVRRTITIPNAPLIALRSRRAVFVAGRRLRRTVARFHDDNRLAEASDHTASIRWGDGTRSRGSVVKRGGDFEVVGSHRYRAAGRRSITVVVRDDRNATLRIRVSALVRR